MKHDGNNQSSALTIYRGPPISSHNVMNFGPQKASNWTAILPTLCKFCFLHHCQASQTKISKQNSTTLCQMADGKSRQQSAVEQLGSFPQEKMGAKKLLHLFCFRRLRHLIANIFWTKHDI